MNDAILQTVCELCTAYFWSFCLLGYIFSNVRKVFSTVTKQFENSLTKVSSLDRLSNVNELGY